MAYRLQHMGLKVDGVNLDFSRYPYVPSIIDYRGPMSTIVKGAQMGFSIAVILQAIEELRTQNLRGSLYLLPTDDEVQDLAKTRVDPILAQAAFADLGTKVNTAGLKEVGSGFWYFRGAGQKGQKQASMSKLKSFPADRVKLDEYDEMNPDRVEAARHRLDGSSDPQEVGLSTPTLPGVGVDIDYARSDQRAWLWKCDGCGHDVCLEDTWPDCIAEPTGAEPFFLCSKCRGPLHRRTGRWVARRPSVTDHAGWMVSQLGSLVKSPGRILDDLSKAEERGRMREFTNQVLARPYAEVEDLLNDEMMDALVNQDRPRARSSAGPCAMGVDPGVHRHWYVIGERTTEVNGRVLTWGFAESPAELGQLAKRFNVQSGVMDVGAETNMVRAFVSSHPGWWACNYVNSKTNDPDWSAKTRSLKVSRTATLDQSHRAIIDGLESFPAADEVYQKYVKPQMQNLGRAKVEDSESGTIKYKWVIRGGSKNDHLKHAYSYYRLALKRVGIRETARRTNQRGNAARAPSAMAAL